MDAGKIEERDANVRPGCGRGHLRIVIRNREGQDAPWAGRHDRRTGGKPRSPVLGSQSAHFLCDEARAAPALGRRDRDRDRSLRRDTILAPPADGSAAPLWTARLRGRREPIRCPGPGRARRACPGEPMRRATHTLLAFLMALLVIATAGAAARSFTVRRVAETAKTITLGWDRQAPAGGYRFYTRNSAGR